MGKRGPKPARTGRDDHGNDVAPALENLEPPEHLTDLDAVAIWHRLAPSLSAAGVLTAWDVDTFAILVTALVHHRRAVRHVDERGVMIKQRSSWVKNPALQVVRDQAAVIAVYAARFALTPADRARLALGAVEPGDETGGVDPFA